MPLFSTWTNEAKQLKKRDFKNEKELQTFIEKNLEYLFGIRFVATEYSTSKNHWGRIDTLGLDENNSPVIIEYKWWEKDNIINQGLFYLDWLVDHTGDFQILTQNKLWMDVEVDFGSPRVLLIAQSFSKYDQYAINRMSENIELWSYARYENDLFELKLTASSQAKTSTSSSKSQISKVNYDEYSVENHLEWKPEKVKELFYRLQEKIFALESDQNIEEIARKIYISYRTSRAFLYMHIQSKWIKMHLIVDNKELDDPRWFGRDVSNIWHHGHWNTEVILRNMDDLEYVMKLIEQSYLQSI